MTFVPETSVNTQASTAVACRHCHPEWIGWWCGKCGNVVLSSRSEDGGGVDPAPLDEERRALTLCAAAGCWRRLCREPGCSLSFCCFVCERHFFCGDDDGPRHGPACNRHDRPAWDVAPRASPAQTPGFDPWLAEPPSKDGGGAVLAPIEATTATPADPDRSIEPGCSLSSMASSDSFYPTAAFDASQLGGSPQPGKPPAMVMALGKQTSHWTELKKEFPEVVNCCIDVTEAFKKGHDESTSGSGFDRHTRERMMAKDTWETVWEVALEVLMTFNLLVVLCNHGKHRSLSLAYELHKAFSLELVSIRKREGGYRNPSEFKKAVVFRLEQHRRLFAHVPHPVLGIVECSHPFDGSQWQQTWDTHHTYLNLTPHCLVIVLRVEEEGSQEQMGKDSEGWARGRLVGGCGVDSRGWFPCNFCCVYYLSRCLFFEEY